jgi:hypothetical protein
MLDGFVEEKQVAPASSYNLVGFFDLLLAIDRRVNPERYEFRSEND